MSFSNPHLKPCPDAYPNPNSYRNLYPDPNSYSSPFPKPYPYLLYPKQTVTYNLNHAQVYNLTHTLANTLIKVKPYPSPYPSPYHSLYHSTPFYTFVTPFLPLVTLLQSCYTHC